MPAAVEEHVTSPKAIDGDQWLTSEGSVPLMPVAARTTDSNTAIVMYLRILMMPKSISLYLSM